VFLRELFEVETKRSNSSGLFSTTNTVVGLGTDSSPVAQNDRVAENSDACRLVKGRDPLFPCGPCLSQASWSALPKLASVPSYEARRGVTGFGHFCRNKSGSPAGAKPGNTKNHANTKPSRISSQMTRRLPPGPMIGRSFS
jgi:hypothetical protein